MESKCLSLTVFKNVVIIARSRAAILGLDFSEPHMLISGGANKQVCSCDLRENNKKAFTQCGSHTGSVLAVAGSGNFIYSASEDCNIAVWDMRKPKIPIIKVEVRRTCFSYNVLCFNLFIYLFQFI